MMRGVPAIHSCSSKRLTNYGVADAGRDARCARRCDRDVAEHAHEFAHGLGIEAYVSPPISSRRFRPAATAFLRLRHGVIRRTRVARTVTQPEVEAFMPAVQESGASRWVLFQCVHGMGHGLTMLYAHDLPRALTTATCSATAGTGNPVMAGAFHGEP